MKNKISISDFRFEFKGIGHYKVIYESPATYKTWAKLITDMSIIDATKNAETPKRVDLERLKRLVKYS